MPKDLIGNPENLLANAVNFLIQGQEFDEASILLLCGMSVSIWDDDYGETFAAISLISNRAVYDIIQDRNNPSTIRIRHAFNAVLPYGHSVGNLSCIVQLVDDIGPDWRTRMLEIIEGKMPLNQCLPIQEKPRH